MDLWDENRYWAFSRQIPLATKDRGLTTVEPWGSQRELIRSIFAARRRGVLQHFVHKSRQLGVTSELQKLQLYLLFHSPGLQGAFVADGPENREVFRDQLIQMATACPDAPPCAHDGQHPGGLRVKNLDQLVWENESRLGIYVAGRTRRKQKRLGIGRGLALLLATEAPLYASPDVFTYLRAAFSTIHPAGLYVFEGTARGRNPWYDLWQSVGDLPDCARHFIGWWRREDYSLAPGDPRYAAFWDDRPTARERRWIRLVERDYDVELRPEHLAWRRWFVRTVAAGDDRLADQECPTLPEEAFEATGESFLGADTLVSVRRAARGAPVARWFRFEFGKRIEQTVVVPSRSGHGTLAAWEGSDPTEAYVVAAVPPYATTPDVPTGVVSVWRAQRDDLIQVAEFADDEIGMQAFAWVCADLAATYQTPRRAFILDIQGAGEGVLQELRQLRTAGWGTHHRAELVTLLGGGLHHYRWRRPDSASGALAVQWKTTPQLRARLFLRLRDQLAAGTVQMRSWPCIRECERVRNIDGAFVPEGVNAQDHRVAAAGLAVESWAAQLRPLFRDAQGTSSATTVVDRMMFNVFEKLGTAPARALR